MNQNFGVSILNARLHFLKQVSWTKTQGALYLVVAQHEIRGKKQDDTDIHFWCRDQDKF